MSIPVFVIGRNRSGTTWLSNQLCEHPQIVGIQHERHHGIKESNYFGIIDVRYGDLAKRVNYAEFVEVMAASDLFRLADADREYLYSLWPTTYEDVFRKVMDRFAQQRGAHAWVAKSDVREKMLKQVLAAYPDARIVGIRRDPVPNIASHMAMPLSRQVRARKRALFRHVMAHAYSDKVLKAFVRQSDRVHVFRYEDLRADAEGTLRDVLEFVGLPWDDAVLGQTYKPNTSFRTPEERDQALTPGEKRLIRVLHALASPIPRNLLHLVDRYRRWRRGRPALPHSMFRLQPFFEEDPLQYD